MVLQTINFSIRRICVSVVKRRSFWQAPGRFMSTKSDMSNYKVPVSLLSGFLGSGKTTLLKELLENKGGLRVGVVVNDVASVNIDAKLVRERSSSGIRTKSGQGVEFVELENGCACCNASEELLGCILQLIDTAHIKGYKFDRIVIEMSGVAEPKNVRREFQEATMEKHPIFEAAELSTMITVVDSPHFSRLYSSKNDVADHEELLGSADQAVDRYDAMKSVEVERKVVDLLVEQIECADVIVLNKIDRLPADKLESLQGIVSALNPAASVLSCTFGKVAWSAETIKAAPPNSTPLDYVFGRQGAGVIAGDDDEDLRTAVRLAKERERAAKQQQAHDGGAHGHGHGHAHAHEHAHAEPAAPAAAAADHGHSHGGGAAEHVGHGGHGHGHAHAPAAATHGDAAHQGHAHDGHGHAHDGGHGHAHAHAHGAHATTAAEKYGIGTFVYSRRRPFHAGRLQDVIGLLPVKSAARDTWIDHMPAENWALDKLAEGRLNPLDPLGKTRSGRGAMHSVIRSKGFVWAASYGRTVLYWSHAGAHFEMQPLGLWWAATPLSYWPEEGNVTSDDVIKIAAEFDTQGEYGDRRQEIVFIGIHMDQAAIEGQLDGCLLTDSEMVQYAAHSAGEPDPVRVVPDPAAPAGRRPVPVADGPVKPRIVDAPRPAA